MFGALLAGCLLLLVGQAARAESALQLADTETDIDAWPAVTLLADADGKLAARDVLQLLGRFQAPTGPHANLGVRREAVWLRIPVTVPERADGRWVLDIDYPSLDRIDVYVVSDALVVRHVEMGDHLPLADRPTRTRSHAIGLTLEAGVDHELLLRIETTSSMIVPVRLMKAEAFHARESRTHLLQGVASGIGLCLLMYALAQFFSGRESMFVYYAGTVSGITMFFFAYYGLAPLTLWPQSPWLTQNMAPLSVLIGLGFGLLLIERLLDVRGLSSRLALVMKAAAGVAFGTALLFVLGVASYRVAHFTSTLLGPMSVLLAVPVAWLRWREGDRGAPYIFAGWGLYAIGITVMAALLRGWVGSNAWTQHAFQAGSMFEMLMWLRVIGVRHADARQRAERADREREVLQKLARTDALTGLPNRRGLEQELALALPHADSQRMLAVFLVDLDGFKAINDRHGHDVGDELLVAVAVRLRSELRHGDVVARLGGDEFVVLARELAGEGSAWQLGSKLVSSFTEPFMVSGQVCKVGLTVGFALAPLDGNDAPGLLRRADAAMYSGKQSGKATVRRGTASHGLAGI
jgi:diguanylate cyclase (GGDEF)-like protein